MKYPVESRPIDNLAYSYLNYLHQVLLGSATDTTFTTPSSL